MASKSKRISKKLINKVEDCVNDNIAGYVALNPGIRQLAGQPRVVVRADLLQHKSRGRVAVLTGGGSGHEPAFTGWLGENMATGAVLGDVFAAPGPASILDAIRALGQNNTGGVLMLFNNYTGDRLNFGIAAERAGAEGVRVEMLLNADDTALITVDNTAGRRGLAGQIFLVKVLETETETDEFLSHLQSWRVCDKGKIVECDSNHQGGWLQHNRGRITK